VGGVDPDTDKRAAFEKRYQVPTFSTCEDLLDSAPPDVVSIATPPETHGELVTKTIEAGVRRVICEKPCTPTLRSCRDLASSLGPSRDQLGVNFTRRFDPVYRGFFSELILDPIHVAIGHYSGGVLNSGSHWIDLLHACGATVTRVLALRRIDATDPSPDILMEIQGGGRIFLAGHDVADHLIFEADVFGGTRRRRWVQAGSLAEAFDQTESDSFTGWNELLPRVDSFQQKALEGRMFPVVDDAIRSIEEDRPMLCTVDDALKVHAVIEAIHSSLSDQSWVEVDKSV
jgi:predicted dehydrogenase